MPNHGCQSNVDRIRRMLIKTPAAAFRNQAEVDAQWQPLNYLERAELFVLCQCQRIIRAGFALHARPVANYQPRLRAVQYGQSRAARRGTGCV